MLFSKSFLKQSPFSIAVICCTASFANFSIADARHQHHPKGAQSHAPIGVMGDHLHKQGEWMFSYRYMSMSMEDSMNNDSDLTTADIIATPNTFAGLPGQPGLLRVVPTEMTMDMHMLGAMYAPSDKMTLMLMTSYNHKDMDHLTFNPSGTQIGTFKTTTKGIGDTSISALIKTSPYSHATLGLSIPTGSVEEKDEILTPAGTRPTVRLPYPMQLGSGTYDVITGLTFAAQRGVWNYGAQWRSVFRTGENDEGYTLGHEHKISSWLSLALQNSLSISTRLTYTDRKNINDKDPAVKLPVQSADPDRHAVERVDIALGLNWLLPDSKNRLALELGIPVYQKLDGPQLETDSVITAGWQIAL